MRLASRLLIFCLLLACGASARAGIADYTDRGKIDFDAAMHLLNPYGTWAKVDSLWAYTPLDHSTPYTHGRWLYTEYGWYWQGTEPYSWATEHYGFWKCADNHVWSWYPASTWLAQIVEIRTTKTHIGWRCAEVDSDGAFVEEPADRYAKTDEWTFVSREQFTAPITPAVIASPEVTAKMLDDSGDSMHTYVTYRAISRPGPHPADFLGFPNTGMFASSVAGEPFPQAPLVLPKPVAPAVKNLTNSVAGASTNSGPAATNGAPVVLTDEGAPADTRQVHYWITLSLPTYWTPRPVSAMPNELYVYRPEFFQDQDGIERRIGLWMNPSTRTSLGDLRQVLTGGGSKSKTGASTSTETRSFSSPFDESFHDDSKNRPKPSSSSKAAPAGLSTPSIKAAPSGLSTPSTNAAP